MTDPTTPTAQPDELTAIRARVNEIKKIRTDAFKFECFMGYEKSLFDISRRLLELLDERDAQLLATERTCTAYAATSEERFDEIESLRRGLAEARGLMQEWYDGLPTYDLAWLESLKTRVSNFLTNQYPDTHMKPLLFLLTILALAGCQKITKSFGGSVTVDLPAGTRLVNASWDEGSDIWSLTRPARPGEQPQTYIMYEHSNIGVMQGTVTFIEH